eukprot:SM000137S00442  [mRNA]  locus=s137:100154:106564:+ [translate_table: standard]
MMHRVALSTGAGEPAAADLPDCAASDAGGAVEGAAPAAAANATATAAAEEDPLAPSPTKAARVVARLHNVPKYALRGEVAALLAAAGVRPQDCATVVDDRYSFRHWSVLRPRSGQPPPAMRWLWGVIWASSLRHSFWVWGRANDFCCACPTEHPRRLTLASEQQFNKVQAIVNARKRIGTRVVKLSLVRLPLSPTQWGQSAGKRQQEDVEPLLHLAVTGCLPAACDWQEDEEQLRQEEENHKHPNRIADEFRMHSVVMGNLPDELNTDQVERFFHGFQIPPSGIKHVKLEYKDIRTPLHKRLKGERRKTIDAIQRRVLVKFRNELEAMRAIRERQGAFLDEMAVELSLLQ